MKGGSVFAFDAGAIALRRDVPSRELTTFGLGADALLVLEPSSPLEMQNVLKSLQRSGTGWRVIGAGSNVVLPDKALEQALVRLGRGLSGAALKQGQPLISVEAVAAELGERSILQFYAGGATSLMALSRVMTGAGLSGLEFAAGIPASIGGAVAMNAGAHGGCIADVLRRVHLVSAEGERILEAQELELGYRRCRLPAGSVVVGAEFELTPDSVDNCRRRRRENLQYRKQTQPLHLPSAGSVFRNPASASAGELLERCGMKGRRKGGVQFSQMHANWLVRAAPGACAADLCFLVDEARERVSKECGEELIPEICVW